VHILQCNDQNLALANMAKIANDMMTRPQLRGVLALPHPACILSWSGRRRSQWGPGTKPPLGSRLGQSPQKLRSVGPLFINFKQNFSNPVI